MKDLVAEVGNEWKRGSLDGDGCSEIVTPRGAVGRALRADVAHDDGDRNSARAARRNEIRALCEVAHNFVEVAL